MDYGDIGDVIVKPFCRLTWNQSPFDFIVLKKDLNDDNVEFSSEPTSNSTYIFKDLTEGHDYMFSVVTVSKLGKSVPTQLLWSHGGKLYYLVDQQSYKLVL